MRTLAGAGVANAIELGAGRVLAGLMRRISREVTVVGVEDPASLAAAVKALGGQRPESGDLDGHQSGLPGLTQVPMLPLALTRIAVSEMLWKGYKDAGRGWLFYCLARLSGDVTAALKCGPRRKKVSMAADVESRVREIISEQLGVAANEVTPEASFIEDLGADSLDIVELVMALEEEYGMEISDEDAEKIRTVKDVVDYIQAHKS